MPQLTTSVIGTLQYPVLRFSQGMVFPARNHQDIERCSKVAMTNGFFDGQIIVDADARTLAVRRADKLRGIGPFWGYNLFLNQKIEVALLLDELPPMSLEEVRAQTITALTGKQHWDSAADFKSVLDRIRRAAHVRDIAVLVTESYFRQKEEF